MDWVIKNHLECDSNGLLKIGNITALDLITTYGTPLLVINEQRVRSRFREFFQAVKKRYADADICYAIKANPSLAILKILLSEGSRLEVVSEYELLHDLKSGAKSGQIVFNGPNKTERELELAVRNNVLINVDSFAELRRLESICRKLTTNADICIRVNPAVEPKTHGDLTTGTHVNQFGACLDEAENFFVYASAAPNIVLKGIHMHIGSQITSLEPFIEAINKIFSLMARLKEQGIVVTYLDLGGGLGVQYEGVSRVLSADEYADAVISTVKANVKQYGLDAVHLIFEPGRFIMADAGVYLLKVGTIKEYPRGNNWVLVDGGSNILLRAALGVYRFPMILANKADAPSTGTVNVAGPLCFGGDVIGKNVKLPRVEEGDILAVFCAGAYTDSISHQYNLKPRPAMVLVNNGMHSLIKRAEQYEDLAGRDILPDHLR